MNIKSKQRSFLAGLLLGAAGIITAHATANSFVTFSVDLGTNIANGTFTPWTETVSVSGTFNGWGEYQLTQVGSSTVYSGTVNDLTDSNGLAVDYKFVINTNGANNYETCADGNNRAANLPTTSGASVTVPTAFYGDSGAPTTNEITFQVDMSQQINLGLFTNGSSTVVVSGWFNGWPGGASTNVLTWTPTILVTNQYGLVSSNVYVGTFAVAASPGATVPFKFVENGNYEGTALVHDSGNNRFFVNPNPAAALTLATVFYNDQPFAPLSQVTFSVDMSVQLYYGVWTPSDGVFCQGINGNWNNNASTMMTNNPSASNTNIYYVTLTAGQGSGQSWKFTYNGGSGTVYEQPISTSGNNRTLTIPSQAAYSVQTVLFSDQTLNDLLSTAVNVSFAVDMTSAVQYGTTTAFNPSSDVVFVNGSWLNWASWTPIALASYQLTNNPVGPQPNVYSGTFSIPLGSALSVIYKYSIDGQDNEAPSGSNHLRIIRSIPTGAYSFPTDTFGNQYNEPQFGELSVGKGVPGTVLLSWLGAPNVTVQTSSSINGASWTTLPLTSGAYWSAGISSTNGLISQTNWPTAGANTFFRLLEK